MTVELQGKKLLIIEDDSGICDLLNSFFAVHGVSTTLHHKGSGVEEVISRETPDLILLDIVLPEKDGFTILQELRQKGNRIPVIMLTEQATINDKVKGLLTGADDYITKPFSTRELLARVTSLIRRVSPHSLPAEPVQIGQLSLHLTARELFLPNRKQLPLTKTEFDLFAYLAGRRPEPVTHRELLEEVLGYRSDTETKALVMHITNIRKKLVIHHVEEVRIETLAGIGYKLAP